MRMDENTNPEWMRQLQGSKSGRAALSEIERLTDEIRLLTECNEKLSKLSESLMLYEDEYYDEAKALLKTITVSDNQEQDRVFQAFQYAYGAAKHPSMRGSTLQAAWKDFQEYVADDFSSVANGIFGD